MVAIDPLLSVTVKVGAYVPLATYSWFGFALFDIAPSPKFQLNVIGSPSGSYEPVLVKFTDKGARPDVGVAESKGTGRRFPVV